VTRVLYGFSGEGSGHSSRAREMMRHLAERGHAVLGASYDRG
jgi:UDP:flavonoid glycosyltransferase YjiC (YdhE family)